MSASLSSLDAAVRMPEPTLTPEQVEATIRSRRFVVLLLVAAIAGVVVSLAAWCFLELINQIQRGVYVHLPSDLGYHHGPPLWWSLPVLVLAGLIVAFAIERLPGEGGHVAAYGLSTSGGPTLPNALPGSHARGARGHRARGRARPGGAADRARLGPGCAHDPPGTPRRAAPGRDGAGGGGHVRRGVVPVPVAVDRRDAS